VETLKEHMLDTILPNTRGINNETLIFGLLWGIYMKISTILREATVKQIQNDFIRFDEDTNELEGKCVLGVMGCGSPDERFHLDKSNSSLWNKFNELFKSYDLEDIQGLPYLHTGNHLWDWKYTSNLSGIMMKLNDSYRLTFDEIADFLEETFGY